MGRPRKPVALHLIQNTFRPQRHAHLLPTASEPAVSPPEPEIDPATAALREEAETWRVTFETGDDFFSDIEGLDDSDEAAFLMAVRAAWARLGPTFMDGWAPSCNVTRPFAHYAFGDPARPKRPRRSLAALRAAFDAR